MAAAGVFDWQQVLNALGATALIVAALAWIAQLVIGEYFKKRMAGSLARLDAALGRAERLEAELLHSRGESYGAIWVLTGAVNLFGPSRDLDQGELSESLKDWYFQHGWLLSREAKGHYFLVQEALNFALTRSISFTRPAGEVLFGGDERPEEILKRIRHEALAIPVMPPDRDYSREEVEAAVVRWKQAPGASHGFSAGERGWMLFQFALSSLRTRLAAELGSRRALDPAP